MVSYQTAWLKANHPVEFMAAVMNCDMHLTDKLGVYKREVDKLGIVTVPPCVNRSHATFSVKDQQLVYALGALKNVGVEAMKLIVEGRTEGGVEKPFATLFDFARRVDLKRIGKRPLEMLARAGAFDVLDGNRRTGVRGAGGAGRLFGGGARGAGLRPRCRCSARPGRISPSRGWRGATTGCRSSGWPRSISPSASTSRAIRSTITWGR